MNTSSEILSPVAREGSDGPNYPTNRVGSVSTGDILPGNLRVLYVDDEPDLLEIGRTFLETGGGFTVDTLDSAKEALSRVAALDPP